MTHDIMDVASPITYGASAMTVVAGLTVNEWGVMVGVTIALATFIVNWIYKHKTFKKL